jgi:serine/threonine-protein kinase
MHYLEDPDPQEDDLVGKILCGKWRVLERIGRGGMSTVYAATHRNGRKVAVKVLRRSLAANRRIVARFLREGYVANKIRHPGAVAVLDDDVDDGNTVFLVMEYLDGATIAQRYGPEKPPPSVGEALDIGERILDVLGAAHASGVVHRDVKPSNVFLKHDKTVMLLATLGTPGFMAPEQARGRGNLVDARTDIWAVGALLFFLYAGRTVHEAETPNELLIASATQPAPSVGAFCSGLPQALVEIVDRALAMDRDDRWPNATTMRDAIIAARKRISDDVLRRSLDRAVGATGATTLPETHTAEPAVVPRRAAQEATPAARAQSRPARGPAVRWALAVAAVSIAGGAAVLLRSPETPAPSAEVHAGTESPSAVTSEPRGTTAPNAEAPLRTAEPDGLPQEPIPPHTAAPAKSLRKPAAPLPAPSTVSVKTASAVRATEAPTESTHPAASSEVDVLDLRR